MSKNNFFSTIQNNNEMYFLISYYAEEKKRKDDVCYFIFKIVRTTIKTDRNQFIPQRVSFYSTL